MCSPSAAVAQREGLRSFCDQQTAKRAKILKRTVKRDDRATGQRPRLAGKRAGTVGNQQFSVTGDSRVQKYLSGSRVGCRVFRQQLRRAAERQPGSLTAPTCVLQRSLERELIGQPGGRDRCPHQLEDAGELVRSDGQQNPRVEYHDRKDSADGVRGPGTVVEILGSTILLLIDAMKNRPPIKMQPQKTLVDESIEWVMHRIHRRIFTAGARLPSIRALARQRDVSPFTISEAYGRLVAVGILEARKGSGYYARAHQPQRADSAARRSGKIDLSWLLHHMLSGSGARGPGLGVLPSEWLNGIEIGAALRSLGRQGRWFDSGRPSGFEPLRGIIQRRLADLDILAAADQIILTTGITHALNLVLRVLVRPGDTVLTSDPNWFGALGMLSQHGARIIGIPLNAAGLDIDRLERTVFEAHPRLLILSSIAHNPTGQSLPLDAVKRVVNMARKEDFWIFEDDVYADLTTTPVQRLAAEGGLSHVIYANSFSKTLASNIRVGFMTCEAPLAQRLSEAKLLGGFTTPELNERLVHKLLLEGHYSSHAARLRQRLILQRARMRRFLAAEGVEVLGEGGDGLFLWANMQTDTTVLAEICCAQGLLLAPGALFSPRQEPSTWMRINATTSLDDVGATLARRRSSDLLAGP